jgi:hypothetical protein
MDCPNIYFEPDVAGAEEGVISFIDGAQALLGRAPALGLSGSMVYPTKKISTEV